MSDIEHIMTTQKRLANENKPDALQKHTEQETNHECPNLDTELKPN